MFGHQTEGPRLVLQTQHQDRLLAKAELLGLERRAGLLQVRDDEAELPSAGDFRRRKRLDVHPGGPQHRRHLNIKALDRKSTRLNSSHITISYAVFCLKKKKTKQHH